MIETPFYGRLSELEVLEDAFERPMGEMAIIYGRRRIGKTALIQKFCEGETAFIYTAKPWKDAYQLALFSEAVSDFCGAAQVRFFDWVSALKTLAEHSPDARKVIVIDEFQYIAQERPSLLSELQVLWGECLGRENILLILCGSAVSFIAQKVFGERNPLFGRARTVMKVPPLPLATVAQFAPTYNADEIFLGYAVLGGVPYFWQGINPQRSMTENLAANVLRANGFLNDEAQSVLRQEFRAPSSYNAILRSIAFGASTSAEIAQKSLVDIRTLKKYLDVLENIELVEREFPVFVGPGDLGNATRGLYQISDPNLKFWFRFLSNSPVLMMTRQEAMAQWEAAVEPSFAEFASAGFEDVCRQYLLRQLLGGKLPFRLTAIGRWWHNDVEIDLVGADHDRRHCLAAECKYRREPSALKVFRSLQARLHRLPVAEGAVFHYWLFSRSGFQESLQQETARNPALHLVGIEDLLE